MYESDILEIPHTLNFNLDLQNTLGKLKKIGIGFGIFLVIIFVFDPLAIALVIAANFAFEQLRPKTKENIYGEDIEIKEDPKPEFEIEEEDEEKRMDIIGQNGNDGLHYTHETYGNDPGDEHIFNTSPSKESLPKGYVKSTIPQPTFAQEATELNAILGKDLTEEQMQRLKKSKLTRIFNDDNDLKIHY